MATSVSLDDIQGLYIAYFNRPADYRGLLFWQNAANAVGGDINVVANAFAAAPEYTSTFGTKSNLQIVDQIYVNLFGRHAELDGLNFWTDALDKKILGVGNIAYQIMKGAHDTEGGFQDATAVANKIKAATAFYNEMATSAAEVLAYNGVAADAAARTWLTGVTDQASLDAATSATGLAAVVAAVQTAYDLENNPPVQHALTTGVDTLTGTSANDTYTAADGQWTALDSIDGGAGINTFNVAQTANLAIPTGAVLKNITTMNATSGGSITGTLAGQGVTTLNLTAGTTTNVTAAAGTNVNELSSINTSSITGGKNVTITHGTAGNVTSDQAAGSVKITSSFGTVTVTNAAADVTVAAKGNITAGGTSLTASVLDAVSAADQAAHIATAAAKVTAHTAATNADTAAGTVVTDLGTTMAGAIAGSSTAAVTNAATLVALNNGEITVAQKAAIDTAFATGLATSAAAAQAAALAVYTPIVNAATTAKAATAAALVTAAAADTAAAAVVTADAAAAAVVVTDTTNTALTTVSVTGNYNGSAAITDASTLSNTLTSVTLSNAGSATLTGTAINSVTMKDQAHNVTVINGTAAHALTLTLDNVANTVTDVNAGTVNLVSNGTAGSTLNATTAAATAVNITGAGNLDLTGSAFAAAAVITATNSSGTNTVTVAAGQSYAGGSGVDIVTTGAALQTATVNGGAGTADRLILTNTANYATTGAAKYSGFEVLQVNGVAADVSAFTGLTVTSEVLNGGTAALTALTAAQAANVTAAASGTYTLGVTGATTVGQLDTVHLTVSDGLAARNTIALTAPVLAGVETLNLTATDNVTIDVLTSASALTNVNIDGAGTANISTGALALNVNTIVDGHAMTRGLTFDAHLATANGLKIVGSATAANALTSNSLASVLVGGNGGDTLVGGAAADTITAGNGNNNVTGGGGNDTITLGNGNNTVGAASGNTTITVGNGYNTIVTGGGDDTIHVGTGGNFITSGAGADVITLGAHALGTIDTLIYGVASTAVGAVNMDTITGFVSGVDHIQLTAGNNSATSTTVTAGGLAGINLAAGSTLAAMAAVVSDTTAVANTAAVYTQLAADLTAGQLAASATGVGGIVAREVTFTTGAAAGTYLVINDVTAGFQAATDIVIKLVGNTTFAVGDLVVV